MNKKRCAKWKTITAYNESAKEVIHYELDENEKLIIKNQTQKKVPNIIKQISLNNNAKYLIHSNWYHQNANMEISKNMIIFSCESFLDHNTKKIDSIESCSKTTQKENNFKILNFHQADLIFDDTLEQWEDLNLIK